MSDLANYGFETTAKVASSLEYLYHAIKLLLPNSCASQRIATTGAVAKLAFVRIWHYADIGPIAAHVRYPLEIAMASPRTNVSVGSLQPVRQRTNA